MSPLRNICSFPAAALVVVLLTGCMKPQVTIIEQADSVSSATVDPRGYDPLELPRDREIVPALFPRSGDIIGKQVIVEKNPTTSGSDTVAFEGGPTTRTFDTLNSQSYRVQVFTGLVYGEARQVARVAEEIFDQPVYVDYEVPNFKVRIGNWPDRASAEKYQQKARAVGYTNAWVVMAGVNIREVAPLYDDLTGKSGVGADSTGDSVSVDGR